MLGKGASTGGADARGHRCGEQVVVGISARGARAGACRHWGM